MKLMQSMERFWIELSHGLRLRAYRAGSGSTACVLIHGYGEGAYVWHDFVDHLRGMKVLALDLTGHGESPWNPTGHYDLLEHTRHISVALAGLAEREIVLIGHSLGAELVMRAAAECNRVRRLVMVDFAPGMNLQSRQYARAQFEEQFRCYASPAEYASWLANTRPMLEARTVQAIAEATLRATDEGYVPKCDPALVREENKSNSDDDIVRAFAKRITCRTLLVRGAGSAIVSRACVEAFAALMPDASVATVRNAGHAVMLDNPAGFRDAVLPFLLHTDYWI